MKLLSLHIDGFGKFKNKDLQFADNMNIIYGYNEAGKSTIFMFIKAMFYGLERAKGRASKSDTWTKFKPWGNGDIYGGNLRFSYHDNDYRIERDFTKTATTPFAIVNETNGSNVENPSEFLKEALCGLSETAYSNTVSISQLKSATDAKMVVELKNYIANMNTTGNMSLNINKASDFLKDKKKAFESTLDPDAPKTFNQNLTEIKVLEKKISSPEFSSHLKNLKEADALTEKRIIDLNSQKETLIESIASKRQHLSDLGFNDKKTIVDLQSELNKGYNAYLSAYESEKKSINKVYSIIFLVLSIISVILSLYIFKTGKNNVFTATTGISYQFAMILFIVICLASLVFASYIYTMHNKDNRHLTELKVNLIALMARVGSFDSITEENIHRANKTLSSKISIFDEMSSDIAKIEALNVDIDNLRAKKAAYANGIDAKKQNEWELEKLMEKLAQLKEENDSLKNIISENDKIRFEIDAIELAMDTLKNLSETIKNSFGLYLNKDASELIEGITGGVYDSISIDENFNVFLNTPNRLVPIEQASSGTMDQVYLALRIAAGRLMQGRSKELPFIFDDSFVNYDSIRLRAALLWIANNVPEQIIVFSCHMREAQLMTATMQEFNLIEL
ncbi:ATP-binding protein [Lachnoanaerobaculum umeaense]|uniref:AAA family ATPase n=1 Tax=Lachnoanaerobaculum umeaense TaxID=617123 RepID=A0A385Q4R8_9FIRM|nr:AAA family ATPase [Lachnoanaerobaculum umeaense]AYA99863.1 AAA family ATPase [Lachnoanaerobaculum umeaense]PZW96849.1 AAA domain-containing protein [Lachnoanaerobaculum umeaense]